MSGLLDAYEESTSQALDVMAAAPMEPEKPTKKHSAWTAPFRGLEAGASEVLGNVMDITGAAGQVMATAGVGPGQFMLPNDMQQRYQKQSRQAFDDVQQNGLDFRNPGASPVYDNARSLIDPQTAGFAEQAVFGLTKALSKAIGGGVLLGPAGGAAAFGTSEGMTAAENLAAQGVDKQTRTEVGVLTGVLSGAMVALPVAGQTLKQTIGLWAIGGPGSFMAQQEATREILKNADYADLAAQYDPLDPVGLTLSALVPAGFAAWAKRGGFKQPVKPDATPHPDAAPGAVIETAKPAEPTPTQQDMDAAMVHNLTAAQDAHDAIPVDEAAQALGMVKADVVTDLIIQPDLPQSAAVQPAKAEPGMTRADVIKADQPEIPVILNEDGTHTSAAKHLDDVKKLAQDGTDDELGALDAPLLQVAADCFLNL